MNTDLIERMKKRNKALIFTLIGIVFILGLLVVYWAFFDMNRLPTGEYLTEDTSPDGTYTVKAILPMGKPRLLMLYEVS